MGSSKHQSRTSEVWELAKRQHGVVARRQLLCLGLSAQAVHHRIERGRLHPIERGVYAVGRKEVTWHGRWMAAVLACGPRAVLSHFSAGALLGLVPARLPIEISVPVAAKRRRPNIIAHRRPTLRSTDVTTHARIPTTAPVRTLIDLARRLDRGPLERVVNDADRLDLINPEALFDALEDYPGHPGVGPLRAILGDRTFRLTESELERRFLPLAAEAGLSLPQTGRWLNGFKVDFYWPDLGLVVETDGLRYHRTPAQQAKDRRRDQAHLRAGLIPLRFTHQQVRYEPGYVRETLRAVVARA